MKPLLRALVEDIEVDVFLSRMSPRKGEDIAGKSRDEASYA